MRPTEAEKLQAAYGKELDNYPPGHPLRMERGDDFFSGWGPPLFPAEPGDDHMMLVGEYTVSVRPNYIEGFRCMCCERWIPWAEINGPANRPLRVTGQALAPGMVLVLEGLCPSCCIPRDCEA